MEEQKNRNEKMNDIIENFKEGLTKVIEGLKEDNKDVDIDTEPMVIMYKQIIENTIDIINNDITIDTFTKLSKTLSEEAAKSLLTMIAFSMSTSAFNSLVFYDALLKAQINEGFEDTHKQIMDLKSYVTAFKTTLEVFRRQVNEINTSMKIDKFKDQNKFNDN